MPDEFTPYRFTNHNDPATLEEQMSAALLDFQSRTGHFPEYIRIAKCSFQDALAIVEQISVEIDGYKPEVLANGGTLKNEVELA